mmetsp:Transcript_80991/g.196375  ORF Transcript_80991/g.196375 Transcript_80991/m.196375 type:complete len:233 (-) Transcript_80991:39-737(-)
MTIMANTGHNAIPTVGASVGTGNTPTAHGITECSTKQMLVYPKDTTAHTNGLPTGNTSRCVGVNGVKMPATMKNVISVNHHQWKIHVHWFGSHVAVGACSGTPHDKTPTAGSPASSDSDSTRCSHRTGSRGRTSSAFHIASRLNAYSDEKPVVFARTSVLSLLALRGGASAAPVGFNSPFCQAFAGSVRLTGPTTSLVGRTAARDACLVPSSMSNVPGNPPLKGALTTGRGT